MLVREIVRADLIYTAEREREVCKQHHTASRRGAALAQKILSLRVHSQESNTLAHLKQKHRAAHGSNDTSSCDVPSNKRSCLKCHRAFIFCFGILTACARSACKIQTLTTSFWLAGIHIHTASAPISQRHVCLF